MTFRIFNKCYFAVLTLATLGLGCVTSNVESPKDAKTSYAISRPLSYKEMLSQEQLSQTEGLSHYAKALYLRSIGEEEAAKDHLFKAMAAYPESETILKEVIGPLMMAKEFDKALQLLEKLARSVPNSKPCNIIYSELLFLKGEKEKAIAFIRDCMKASPDAEAYPLQLVKYLFEQNQFDDLDELLQALLAKPAYRKSLKWLGAYSRFLMAAYHQHDGDIPATKPIPDGNVSGEPTETAPGGKTADSQNSPPPTWEKYTQTELRKRIDTLLDDILALPIENPEDLAEIGSILALDDQWQKMLALLKRVEAQNSELAKSIPYLKMKLDALDKCGDKAALKQCIAELSSHQDLSPALAEKLADKFADQKNYAMAIQMIELCLSSNQDSFDLIWRLCTLLMANREYDKALRLLTIRESLPAAGSYLLGLIWKHKGDFNNAYMSMKIAEADPALRHESFFFNMAVICEQCGKIDEALEYARKAYETDPENPSNGNFYGYMLADHDRKLPTALKLLQKVIASEPENPAYLDSIAWVYYRMRQFDKALEFIFKALECNGLKEDPEGVIADHAGDICIARKLTALARFYWNIALHSQNSPADKARIGKKLEENRP